MRELLLPRLLKQDSRVGQGRAGDEGALGGTGTGRRLSSTDSFWMASRSNTARLEQKY